jgi:hypothetical protein
MTSRSARSVAKRCGAQWGRHEFSIAAVMPEVAFIKAGSLDDASWLEPAVEAWTTSAQPWCPRSAGSAQLERGPG